MAEGDLIRARITDGTQEITNGDRGQITTISTDQVTLKLNDGREVAMPMSSLGARGLEHDYAATAHAVQGESTPHVIVAMQAREGLATQKAFYVQISRAQETASLYTDHPTQLARNIADNTGIHVTALEARIEGALERPTPEAIKAVTWAVDHMSERSSSWGRVDLEVMALQRMGNPDPNAIATEVDRRLAEGSLFDAGGKDHILTDKASVALESSILMSFHAAKSTPGVVLADHADRTGSAALTQSLGKTRTLTDGQKDAITTSLTGEGRYVGVQGFAGTGKTFMLERMAHYASQSAYEVKGYAPSHQAVQELSPVLGKAETLASLLTTERNDPQDIDNSRTILVVDESSMIGAKDMRSLMTYADRTNAARVVFVGDTQQLDAVAAGQPFDQLQEAGMRTAIMDEIRRQKDARIHEAVTHSIRGNIHAAFEKLSQNVKEVEGPVEEAAKTWLALPEKEREGARVITLTNADRKEVNGYIRAALKEEDKIYGREVEIAALQASQLTEAQLTDARSYKVGQRVLSMVNSRTHGLEKHALYVVTGKDAERNSLMVRHETEGTEHLLPLTSSFNRRELGKSLVAYDAVSRDIAKGDAIRFRITDKDAGITNGQRATVTTTTRGAIGAELQDGTHVVLRTDSLAARGMDHDYAATAHAVQGASISHPIVVMHASEQLSHQKSFYVDISRAVDKVTLITDDAEKLQQSIEKNTGERSTALETWLESQRAGQEERSNTSGQGNDRPQEQERGDGDADKSKDHDKTNSDRAHSPDAIDPKLEERIKEMEQVVERMRTRQKEIVR